VQQALAAVLPERLDAVALLLAAAVAPQELRWLTWLPVGELMVVQAAEQAREPEALLPVAAAVLPLWEPAYSEQA
jgi:hypothetical protein